MTLHAIKRAKERYGLDLTEEDLRYILDKILEGDAKEVMRPNVCDYVDETNKNYRLRFNGILIEPVVSFKYVPTIITFCPTGKRADRSAYKWMHRFHDESFKHLMRKLGKDRR